MNLELLRAKAVAKRALLRNVVLASGVASHPSAVDDLVARLAPAYDVDLHTGKIDGDLIATSAPHRPESPGRMTPAEMLEHIRANNEATHLFKEPGGRRDGSDNGGSAPPNFENLSPEQKLVLANEISKPAGYH